MNSTPGIDRTTPHSSRVYDYWLGGKTNFAPDRAEAERVLTDFPHAVTTARSNRRFALRAARYLADQGVRQFLDIGSGIPSSNPEFPDLHQAVQERVPSGRIVYVDNDPLVLTHAEALLTGTPEGRIAYLHGDATDPAHILESPEVTHTLDLSEPVALCLVSVAHFLPVSDDNDPYDNVGRLMEALPSGSYLVLTHVTSELTEAADDKIADYRRQVSSVTFRTKPQILRFFQDWELTDPGLVMPYEWRPEPGQAEDLVPEQAMLYAGVARKP